MELYQPKALKNLLKNLKAVPRKSLSQNFLIDGNIVRKIIAAAQIERTDHILEIGPGPGVLTEAFLKKGSSVTAIEKDDLFFATLNKWDYPSLTVIHQDILKVTLSTILKNNTKVVANIPYSITGILLQKLLPMGNQIDSLTLMLQKEVAERLTAKKGSSRYSSFTLYTQYYSEPKLLFSVGPTCFYPRPKVTSAVVQLKLKKNDENASLPFPLIRQAFHQRRKMLHVSLKSMFLPSMVKNALRAIKLPINARPQELSLEDFQTLYLFLKEQRQDLQIVKQ